MPIPILKGLRRAGHGQGQQANQAAENERVTPGGSSSRSSSSSSSSSRSQLKSSSSSATPPAVSSHIPSPNGPRTPKAGPGHSAKTPSSAARSIGARSTPASPRGLKTPTSPSPRPPPRTSSILTSPRIGGPPRKGDGSGAGASLRPRIGVPKRVELPSIPSSSVTSPIPCESTTVASSPPSINVQTVQTPPPQLSHSNRSSVISNCSSSIPPPSSSSSNRNSNSSISSNFSLSSWNSNGGSGDSDAAKGPNNYSATSGSETFPRSNWNRRSHNTADPLVTSVDGDSAPSSLSQNSLQRPSLIKRSRIQTNNKSLHHPHRAALSSSESTIVQPPKSTTFQSSCPNNSESNISKLKATPKITKSSAFSKSSYNVLDRKPAADAGDTATRRTLTIARARGRCADNIASVSGIQRRVARSRNDEFEEDGKAVKKVTKVDSMEEDDGYSSVANTDQHDEDDSPNLDSIETYKTPNSSLQLRDGAHKSVIERMKPIIDDYDDDDDDSDCLSLIGLRAMEPFSEGVARYIGRDHDKRMSQTSDQGIVIEDSQSLDSVSQSDSYSSDLNSTTDLPEPKLAPSDRDVDANSLKIKLNKTTKINYTEARSNLDSNLLRAPKYKENLPESKSLPHSKSLPNSIVIQSPSLKKLERKSPTTPPTPPTPPNLIKTGSRPIARRSLVYNSNKKNVGSAENIEPNQNVASEIKNVENTPSNLSFSNFPSAENNDGGSKPNWLFHRTINGAVSPALSERKFAVGSLNSTLFHSPPSLPSLCFQNPSGWSQMSKQIQGRPSSITEGTAHADSAIINNTFHRTSSLRSPSKDKSSAFFPPPGSRNPNPFTVDVQSNDIAHLPFVRGSLKYCTVIPRAQGTSNDDGLNEIADGDWSALKRELCESRMKVCKLTEQIDSTTKLVNAYEHSLTNMTHRLQHLTKVTEQKENEVVELRRLLDKSCLDQIDACKGGISASSGRLYRGTSAESLSSVGSSASTSSTFSNASISTMTDEDGKKKKGWLRSSFSKAFKRRDKRKRDGLPPIDTSSRVAGDSRLEGFFSDFEARGYCSLPASPLPQQRFLQDFSQNDHEKVTNPDHQSMIDQISYLRRALQEKEALLTESRLESLSSSHQIESLKESVHRLSSEVASFRTNKENLTLKVSPVNSNINLFDGIIENDRLSPACSSDTLSDTGIRLFDCEENSHCEKMLKVFLNTSLDNSVHSKHFCISNAVVSNKTSWTQLDALICQLFEKHLLFLDVTSKLQLNADSILYYQLGEIKRVINNSPPELIPYGYIVGEVDGIEITLRGPKHSNIDSLVFDTLIPKSHLQKYITILKEHRRVFLSGPSYVGKSFLAQKFAEFVIHRLGIEPSLGNIAKFNVNPDNEEDLSAYLNQLSHLCESRKTSNLPLVIIVESESDGSFETLSEIFSRSLRAPHDQCPFVIATVKNASAKINIIDLHSSFRVIPLNPMQEPVGGLLERFCLRHSADLNCRVSMHSSSSRNLEPLLQWLPKCWMALNRVLASDSEPQTIGPCVFLPLPLDISSSQKWFSDIWRITILPRLQRVAQGSSHQEEELERWKNLNKCLREDHPWTSDATISMMSGIESIEDLRQFN